MTRFLSFLVVLLLTVSAFADAPCAAITTLARTTYGFHPRSLSASQQQEKSQQLDLFWNRVKEGGPATLDCVRHLVIDERSDAYFQFDAALLLASIDASHASDAAIETALLHIDLLDVQSSEFIELALRLQSHGVDIGAIAHHYMQAPTVDESLAGHGGYRLDRTGGAVLLYGAMPPGLADRWLAGEVGAANPAYERNSAAIVWSMILTEASLRGIAALADDASLSREARSSIAFARTWKHVATHAPKYPRAVLLRKLARLPEMEPGDDADADELDNSLFSALTVDDLDAVRAARARMITGVSNDSVDGWQELSRMLLNVINARDLYHDLRVH